MRSFVAAVLVASAAALPSSRPAASKEPAGHLTRHEFSSRQMGTEARIVLFAASEASAREAAARAFARIAALDEVMSDYRDTSELMRLCRQAGTGPVRVSEDLFRVLEASQKLARESDGAFDVTAAPLIHLWRRARRISELPDSADITAARKLTGITKLILNRRDRTVALRERNMQLDLGGIGKGFAADEAAALLKSLGYGTSLVALGGDIVATGAPPGTKGWTIDVADLRARDRGARQLVLRDAAVSTSGDAEQWVEIGGVRYSHIIDPRTGSALTGRRSVTVIAPTGTLSDGLATAVSVLGPSHGIALIKRMPGTAVSISIVEGDAIRTVTSPRWHYFADSGPMSTLRNSTSEPSA